MKRLIITLGCLLLTIGGFLGTAASAQSYLDRNASPTDIKRALQGTRSISRRAPTSAPAPRRSAGASAGTPTGSGKTAVRRAAAGAAVATGAVAAQPLPPSEGDLEEGPASLLADVRQYLTLAARLYRETEAHYQVMASISKDWARAALEALLCLDIVQVRMVRPDGKERAAAVLLPTHPLHLWRTERLSTLLRGLAQPFDPDRPAAAINRRVTFAAPEGEADDAGRARGRGGESVVAEPQHLCG